jgi:serine/threonine-protein kinase
VTNEEQVIKLLRKTHDTARLRFLDEIKIIKENQDIDGVMKMIDSCNGDEEFFWYVMPKCTPFKEHFNNKTPDEIISGIIQIAKVLKALHLKGVSHRDIKPQNLFYEDIYIIGDFGLVDYPDKEHDLTIEGTSLGPRFTIAPEMRNNPERADGIAADVYSLAKSMWILLTGMQKGFEGQYSPSGSIGLANYLPEIYLNVLEDLIVKSTENDPRLRPSIADFAHTLERWVELQENFHQRNDLDWQVVQYKLFPSSMPEYAEWTNLQEICNIINILGGINSLNHVFFHNGGGLDLKGAKISHEPGLLELDFGSPYLMKPQKLIFCSFDKKLEWNYFYLALEKIEHIYSSYKGSEDLIELEPLQYKKYDYIENYYEKYDDGEGFSPKSYRGITRLTEGNLVIFRKTSSYNLTNSTYDGRHSKMGPQKFREYIRKLVEIGYRVYYERGEDGNVIGKYMSHTI